jgi:uncharacterized small protein (DUF1192 family)
MKRDRAVYMREYRARKRIADLPAAEAPDALQASVRSLIWHQERIEELQEEVRHLKAELAKRPSQLVYSERFNTRPFTPVPKTKK